MNPTDADIVPRMLARDEAVLGTLYDRYGSMLLGLAAHIVGNAADAEEVLMDALLHAWRTARDFDAHRGSLGAWLTALVRSRALDRARSKRRRIAIVERRTPEEVAGVSIDRPNPAAAAEDADRRRAVAAALASLAPAQRDAITMAYYEGLTHSEIAERSATPLGTVKTRIRDGMRKLRDALRPAYGEVGA